MRGAIYYKTKRKSRAEKDKCGGATGRLLSKPSKGFTFTEIITEWKAPMLNTLGKYLGHNGEENIN